jgi:hypothetical protein
MNSVCGNYWVWVGGSTIDMGLKSPAHLLYLAGIMKKQIYWQGERHAFTERNGKLGN